MHNRLYIIGHSIYNYGTFHTCTKVSKTFMLQQFYGFPQLESKTIVNAMILKFKQPHSMVSWLLLAGKTWKIFA